MRDFFPLTEKDILRKHQILLRKSEYYFNAGAPFLSKFYMLRLYRMQNKYAIHIPMNTCEKGLRLMHVGSILINGNATVGKNCVFHINTALVAGGVTSGSPVLGDGVILGIGAIVVGGVHIAKNVAVGANAVVTKNIEEENIAVAGIPAKKVSENGRLCWNQKGKGSRGSNA